MMCAIQDQCTAYLGLRDLHLHAYILPQRWAVTRSSPMPAKRRRKSPDGIDVAVGHNVRFSDKRHQFHNATPLARAALLNGPPRLVAEDKDRVAIVFSVHRDRLRACLESIRELHPLLDELRVKVPECEPYPLPPWGTPRGRHFLGGPNIRVTSQITNSRRYRE